MLKLREKHFDNMAVKLRLLIFSTVVWSAAWLTACGDETPQLATLPADAVILAFGDSLTYGTGAREAESYPAILEALSGREVINAGMPGELSASGLRRLPALLEEYQPDLLILCHGGNDILRKKDLNVMQGNLRQMIRLAQAERVPVVLLGVPKFGLLLSAAEQYRAIADGTGVVYLEDLVPGILRESELKSDPVHPNRAGYRRMAEAIYATLRETGAL